MLLKLLLIASALLALTTALAGVAAWQVWRLLRRRLRVEQRLRAVKVWVTPPGARREVAVLRRKLAAAVGATPRAVTVVQRASGVVGDLPQLARRLQRAAATLDAELELLGAEPDPSELARMLPPARARVADVAGVARSIRRAAAAGLDAGRADLRELNADVEREMAALAGGVEALLELAAGRDAAAGGTGPLGVLRPAAAPAQVDSAPRWR
jgi:hypothetical protein